MFRKDRGKWGRKKKKADRGQKVRRWEHGEMKETSEI